MRSPTSSLICRSLLLTLLAALTACGALNLPLPPAQVPALAPSAWQAPLPHQGGVVQLSQWWQRQGDPLLLGLIEAAQKASPTVSQALSRIAGARATQAQANAALLPGLSAQASAARGLSQPGMPSTATLQGGLMASWELDVVGANRAVSEAANAQVQSTQAQWHDARVSVAAEVAHLYFNLRTCHQLQTLARQDADSQQETARLSGLSADAGFISATQAGLARAAAADSRARLSSQSAQCDAHIKALALLEIGTHRIFNLGSGTGHSVAEVIAAATNAVERAIPCENSSRRAGDPAVLVADITRAKSELGWAPTHSLEEIVQDTWESQKSLQNSKV